MALLGGRLLELALPRPDKRLLVVVETDGCFADGVSVVTNCWVGRRTLRVLDYGKVAATFVDTRGGRAVRVWPRPDVRALAAAYAPGTPNRWRAQLEAYQAMPDAELLRWEERAPDDTLAQVIGRPGRRVLCARCGEEILNDRELVVGGVTLCRGCAGACPLH